MGLAIYKSGQGYWTRMLTAIGASTIVAAGLAFAWSELNVIRDDAVRMYTQAGVCVGVLIAFALLAWHLLNKPTLVDFMIATEAEMKKVNWPSRREIVGSTIVVIVGTFMLSSVLFIVNLLFGYIFQKIDILEG
jgi:preprotein translocase subunit SecE